MIRAPIIHITKTEDFQYLVGRHSHNPIPEKHQTTM